MLASVWARTPRMFHFMLWPFSYQPWHWFFFHPVSCWLCNFIMHVCALHLNTFWELHPLVTMISQLPAYNTMCECVCACTFQSFTFSAHWFHFPGCCERGVSSSDTSGHTAFLYSSLSPYKLLRKTPWTKTAMSEIYIKVGSNDKRTVFR